MKKLNLDYVLDLVNLNVGNFNIESLSAVKGDWLYLSGNTHQIHKIFEFITQQIESTGSKARLNDFDLLNLDKNDLSSLRRKIAYINSEKIEVRKEEDIVTHMLSLGHSSKSSCLEQLNKMKDILGLDKSVYSSNIFFSLLKSLSTSPDVLFIDFAVDHLSVDTYRPFLKALSKYTKQEGLVVLFCTNNTAIKKEYLSKEYLLNENILLEQ